MRACLLVCGCILSGPAVAAPAPDQPLMFVVAIGNNLGHAGEAELRYAERDASAFAETMRALGGVAAQNAIVVKADGAERVRRVLLDTNRRIRAAISRGYQQTQLLVFYSGHAANDGLHLGPTTLAFDEFKDLVESSPARVRVMMLDSCRSGGVTRVKGVKKILPFKIDVNNRMDAEGIAVITSSAANEDSHESDELKGSFFTHHLLSGLRGGADRNRDGSVTLSEVYAYAYQQTLRSSGKTLNLQHPTYDYDIKGKGDLVLTKMMYDRGSLAALVLDTPGLYLIMEGREGGPVVSEVMVGADGASLLLHPGDYFVQRRARDHYLEYNVKLRKNGKIDLKRVPSNRVAYARLVRKGAADLGNVHQVYTMAAARGEILAGQGPGFSALVGYGLDYAWLSFALRARWSHDLFWSLEDSLQVSHTEWGLGLTAQRYIDLRWVSLGFGLTLEGANMRQTFETTGDAPSRTSWSLGFGPISTLEVDLYGPLSLRVEGGALVQILRLIEVVPGREDEGEATVSTPVTWWSGAGFAWRF